MSERLVVGVEGFEPSNNGVRVRCLTAWRHPSLFCMLLLSQLYYYITNEIICQAFSQLFFKKIRFFSVGRIPSQLRGFSPHHPTIFLTNTHRYSKIISEKI